MELFSWLEPETLCDLDKALGSNDFNLL